MDSSRSKRRRKRRGHAIDVESTVAPFGDVPLWGAPMPSEMPNGWGWYTERLRTINPRGAFLYVIIGAGAVLLVAIVGAWLGWPSNPR
jgi:hypothetical protein